MQNNLVKLLNKKITDAFIRYTISVTTLALMVAVGTINVNKAYALESQMRVELSKKIRTNMAEIQDINKTMKSNNTHFAEEKKQISLEFSQTGNREDKRYLLKRSLAVRAKSLLSTATSIVNIQATMEEAISDLEHLERIKKNSGSNGISSNSEEQKKIATSLMVGLRGISKTVSAIDPGSEELIGIQEKLAYVDAGYRANFNVARNGISHQKEIELLEEYHSTLAAVINLIDLEKMNLRNSSNSILQGEIADDVFTIYTNFEPIYESIMSGNNELLEMIDDVNNGPGAPRRKTKIRNINHIGEGY